MSKKIKMFEEEELSFKNKFYILMDLLISNQINSRAESFLLIGIFYIQIISSFFSEKINVFNLESKSDKLFIYIEKIIRIKNLFKDNYHYFQIISIILFVLVILIIVHFFISIILTTRTNFYSYDKIFINMYLKLFIYVGYNIIFDICFSSFCFVFDEYNSNFTSVKCSSQNLIIIILSVINVIIALIFYIFINIYYNDSYYLSNSYYSKMSCNFNFFWGFNCMIISFLITQIKSFTKEIFLLYNFIISICLFFYYIKHYLYYDKYTNLYVGIFHFLYMWTSIFSSIFGYLEMKEKGIIYLITCIIVCSSYFNIKNRIESKIFLKSPFYKISNKYYLLYYFRYLYQLISNIEESYKGKSILSGIIKMHCMECPEPNCLLKTKEDIYLPIINKWNDKNKKEIEDEVFLKNFIIIVMNYFLYRGECTADMYLNLSMYYLKIIGNYCQAIYYYKKVSEIKLSLREEFSFIRLNIAISKSLIEKLKNSNGQCNDLENLDVSMYFKYEELSRNFINEINNDINLSLEFWKTFQYPLKESSKNIDFNKIFKLTDKIRIAKKNVEDMWNKLFKIYGGVNEFFVLYLEYVEQINDDDLKKRDLESLKRKNDNIGEHINNNNYYSILFNKDTGIIIVNGDKGNEGTIEFSNKEIESIFKYKPIDLKGMNITCLMPKLFSFEHSKYMKRYFNIGQKKIIDKNDFKTFGKDKDNSIIKLKLAIKLFPILNDDVLFAGLILKENIDDIIFLDDKYNIQGMSNKIMEILNIKNKNLFQDNEIPFYVICKKFVNFYNIFLQGKKKEDDTVHQTTINQIEKDDENKNENIKDKKNEKNEKEELHENIVINENVELEYEIKLPQFLIDYSEKSKKEVKSYIPLKSIQSESEDITEIIEEFDEDDLLMDEEKSKFNIRKTIKKKTLNKNNLFTSSLTPAGNPIQTPTPGEETPIPTPDQTPLSDSIDEESNKNNLEQNVVFNKESEEEKLYIERMEKYKNFFNEGKFNELEELIDSYNKDSSSIEYKFNFTFDKYKYDNNKISYIIRCIDNKNEIGQSQEDSVADLDPKIIKYKKEKSESIKPLFEILEEERKEILGLPEIFLNLSLENKKFQQLLEKCKNDINEMSKTYGQNKAQVLEDENSSQSSQSHFDSGLVKKNRIEEIRSNIMMNVSKFYTLKYIKLVIILIGFFSIIFSFIFIRFSYSLFGFLFNSFFLNTNLFTSSLWTSELISIFVSLRVLYLKEIIKIPGTTDFNYLDYYGNNTKFYEHCINKSLDLYHKMSESFAELEMNMPNYLTEEELNNLYWDVIKVSYVNEIYKNYSHMEDQSTFPMSIAQLLSNSYTYLHSHIFNSISNNTAFYDDFSKNLFYFDYMTYIIIENGYDNILPNQIKKISKIPNIISNLNISKRKSLNHIISIFSGILILLSVIYIILIKLTNKSMADGIKKVIKIKLEKIDEIIRKIKLFNDNLKKFNENDLISEENKEYSDYGNNNSLRNNEQIGYRIRKRNNHELSLINNNGFNSDFKKYIPLTVLKYSFLYSFFNIIAFIVCLIPIYEISLKMINATNQLIIIQNYIFSKLIITSSSTIEIKCFLSDCQNKKILNSSSLEKYDIIQEVTKGLNLFPNVNEFYNEKFLLNACSAAFNKEREFDEYNNCLNDMTIKMANNTDNLIKLINELIFNIKKKYEFSYMENYYYNKRDLFNSSSYSEIEKMFFKYLINVPKSFIIYAANDLYDYLFQKLIIVIILIVIFIVSSIIYCLITRISLIKKIIHNLKVSRCIMKIIPTSIIISTPELETWIENKY